MKNRKTAVICFTARGCVTARRIAETLPGAAVWVKMRQPAAEAGVRILEGSVSSWTQERFADSELLIFVGATGIAVRSIAPFLKSKQSDPAVLCVDEAGTFVISLVSGHIGGANEEAAFLSEKLGAAAVITTATDLNGKFAVDVFARQNGLTISDMKLAKYISASILEGERIPLRSEFALDGNIPRELALCGAASDGEDRLSISLSIHRGTGTHTLHLIPGILTIGLGCRRGKDPDRMLSFVQETLRDNGIFPEAVEQIATIDLKADEAAMQAVAAGYGVPLRTFTAEQLQALPGDFQTSEFVRSQVGVGNVCERSAVLGAAGMCAAGQAHLTVGKTARDGMTMAVAAREWRARFE